MENQRRRPWGYRESFAFGAVVFVVGFLLQAFVGRINWGLLAFPVNIIVLAVFLLVLVGMHRRRHSVAFFRWLSTSEAAVASLTWAASLTVIMGLTRQLPSSHVVSLLPGFRQMLTNWSFVLIYFWLATALGMAILRVCIPLSIKRLPFLLNHLGFFIVLVCATLGSADVKSLKMTIREGTAERRAIAQDGNIVDMPMTIALQRFIMETDASSMPRRFASDVRITADSGKEFYTTIEVNQPFRAEGWCIYQYGYDEARGKESDISIFELVRDPWLTFVYIGIFMLLAGAVTIFLQNR